LINRVSKGYRILLVHNLSHCTGRLVRIFSKFFAQNRVLETTPIRDGTQDMYFGFVSFTTNF
jgi:hypothetical protein